MKAIKLLSVIFFLLCFNSYAQDVNKKIMDQKTQKEILIGLCNRDGLKAGDFGQHYQVEYGSYKPEVLISDKIKLKLNKITITIVMGSWCGDSKEQVPRFLKLLDKVEYDSSKITIYCVNRDKKTEKGETDNLAITLVPTFIIYRDGVEIGRIIETPKVSLEADLLEILNK